MKLTHVYKQGWGKDYLVDPNEITASTSHDLFCALCGHRVIWKNEDGHPSFEHEPGDYACEEKPGSVKSAPVTDYDGLAMPGPGEIFVLRQPEPPRKSRLENPIVSGGNLRPSRSENPIVFESAQARRSSRLENPVLTSDSPTQNLPQEPVENASQPSKQPVGSPENQTMALGALDSNMLSGHDSPATAPVLNATMSLDVSAQLHSAMGEKNVSAATQLVDPSQEGLDDESTNLDFSNAPQYGGQAQRTAARVVPKPVPMMPQRFAVPPVSMDDPQFPDVPAGMEPRFPDPGEEVETVDVMSLPPDALNPYRVASSDGCQTGLSEEDELENVETVAQLDVPVAIIRKLPSFKAFLRRPRNMAILGFALLFLILFIIIMVLVSKHGEPKKPNVVKANGITQSAVEEEPSHAKQNIKIVAQNNEIAEEPENCTKVTVIEPNTPVRVHPFGTTNKVGTIKNVGTEVCFTENESGWLKISLNGKTGYLCDCNTDLKAQLPDKVRVESKKLNVRRSSDHADDVLGALKSGELVKPIEQNGCWYKIEYDAQVGYINKCFTSNVDVE